MTAAWVLNDSYVCAFYRLLKVNLCYLDTSGIAFNVPYFFDKVVLVHRKCGVKNDFAIYFDVEVAAVIENSGIACPPNKDRCYVDSSWEFIQLSPYNGVKLVS